MVWYFFLHNTNYVDKVTFLDVSRALTGSLEVHYPGWMGSHSIQAQLRRRGGRECGQGAQYLQALTPSSVFFFRWGEIFMVCFGRKKRLCFSFLYIIHTSSWHNQVCDKCPRPRAGWVGPVPQTWTTACCFSISLMTSFSTGSVLTSSLVLFHNSVFFCHKFSLQLSLAITS